MGFIKRKIRGAIAVIGIVGIALAVPNVAAQADVENDPLVHKAWTDLCIARGGFEEEYDEESCACFVGELFLFTSEELRMAYTNAVLSVFGGAQSDVVFSGPFDHRAFWSSLQQDCPQLTAALERRHAGIADHSFVLMPGTTQSKVNPISTYVDWYMEPFGDQ